MSNDINSVVIVGRLTRDAELKYTNTGTGIGKFSIASNRGRKSGDQWTEEVSYFDITIWGKTAENLNQYLLKGTQVCVTGELRQNRWDQDGQARSKVEINCRQVQLIGGKKEGSGNSSESSSDAPKPASRNQPAAKGSERYSDEFDDDIPF